MMKLSRFLFVGLCFVMVSCSVLSGGGSGDTDAEKYAKDLSFPLNEDHVFFLTSCIDDMADVDFFQMGLLLGVNMSQLVRLYQAGDGDGDGDMKCSTLLAAWLKKQYSDGTRNFEVTLMRFVFALRNSIGRFGSDRALDVWKREYYEDLNIETSRKLVENEYDVWKKTYKEHLHATFGNVYNKVIETADWAYLIVVVGLLCKSAPDNSIFIYLLEDNFGRRTEGIRRKNAHLDLSGQAFLMFERWTRDQGKNATFQLLLKSIDSAKLRTLRDDIFENFGLKKV